MSDQPRLLVPSGAVVELGRLHGLVFRQPAVFALALMFIAFDMDTMVRAQQLEKHKMAGR